MQYIPREMLDEVELVRLLRREGSISRFIEKQLGESVKKELKEEVWHRWIAVRIRYDFEFWAALFVRIKVSWENKISHSDSTDHSAAY